MDWVDEWVVGWIESFGEDGGLVDDSFASFDSLFSSFSRREDGEAAR